jgi:hypothetical protein
MIPPVEMTKGRAVVARDRGSRHGQAAPVAGFNGSLLKAQASLDLQ